MVRVTNLTQAVYRLKADSAFLKYLRVRKTIFFPEVKISLNIVRNQKTMMIMMIKYKTYQYGTYLPGTDTL